MKYTPIERLESRQLLTAVLYGTDNAGLFTFSTADGITHRVGTLAQKVHALAFDPQGDLFGVSATNQLIEIDAATAFTTVVSKLSTPIEDMVFSSTGVLYATDGNFLYTIKGSTGAATEISQPVSGQTGGLDLGDDLSFDAKGNLYASRADDSLSQVDLTTGQQLAPTEWTSPTFDIIDTPDLALGSDGVMYGVTSNSFTLISVDPTTAVATTIGSVSGITELDGLTAKPGASTAPPATAPNAPTGVQATDDKFANRVKVTWNAAAGATSYQVFRGTTADAAQASAIGSPVTSPVFNDTTATPGVKYFYSVTASNSLGRSALSAPDHGSATLPHLSIHLISSSSHVSGTVKPKSAAPSTLTTFTVHNASNLWLSAAATTSGTATESPTKTTGGTFASAGLAAPQANVQYSAQFAAASDRVTVNLTMTANAGAANFFGLALPLAQATSPTNLATALADMSSAQGIANAYGALLSAAVNPNHAAKVIADDLVSLFSDRTEVKEVKSLFGTAGITLTQAEINLFKSDSKIYRLAKKLTAAAANNASLLSGGTESVAAAAKAAS